jgi:hypothetical protein
MSAPSVYTKTSALAMVIEVGIQDVFLGYFLHNT